MDNRYSAPDQKNLLRDTIARLSESRDKPPEELEEGMRDVELALVDMRDQLIEGHPRDRRPPEVRGALEGVNVALSLVITVEYPVSSLERKKIEEAIEVLKAVENTCAR